MKYTLTPDAILYHANCQDGFTAAWCAYQRWGLAPQYTPASYDTPIEFEQFRGKDVMLLDFSFKKEDLARLGDIANTVVILDHHESAEKELKDFIFATDGDDIMELLGHSLDCHGFSVVTVFDMERSGAGLAWDLLIGGPRPKIVNVAEDRDLWRFSIPYTRSVSMWMFSYRYDFEMWDKLHDWLEDSTGLHRAFGAGEAIIRRHDMLVHELLEMSARTVQIFDKTIWIANAPKSMSSDAAGILAARVPESFAFTYYIDNLDRVHLSLRSVRGTGTNVSELARKFGGGGHANAAGIVMSLHDFVDGWL